MATTACCPRRIASKRSTVSSSSSSLTPSSASAIARNRRVIMTTHRIGRIVIGCLAAGFVAALGLLAGPVAGAQEHVITGTVLLAFATSWALLAAASIRWTTQPQRWAVLPAVFMGMTGAALLAIAPGDTVIDALGWVWPPLLLALLAAIVGRVHVDLHTRTRSSAVYPVFPVHPL